MLARPGRGIKKIPRNPLAPGGRNWFIKGVGRLWWNWQTRYFEVVVG